MYNVNNPVWSNTVPCGLAWFSFKMVEGRFSSPSLVNVIRSNKTFWIVEPSEDAQVAGYTKDVVCENNSGNRFMSLAVPDAPAKQFRI